MRLSGQAGSGTGWLSHRMTRAVGFGSVAVLQWSIMCGVVGFGLGLSGSLVQAHPGSDDPERMQRRMELRQHLMQERERLRGAVSQGAPLLQSPAPMSAEGERSLPAREGFPHPHALRPDRLSVEERRALRRAILQGHRPGTDETVP